MIIRKNPMEMVVSLYIILFMISSSPASIFTKIGRVILVLAFLIYSFYEIKIPKKANEYIVWILAFLMYGFIGCFFAYSREYAFTYFITLCYVVICNVVLIWLIMSDRARIKIAICSIVWGATIKAAVCYISNGFLCFLESRSTEGTSANTIGLYCAFAVVICWFILNSGFKQLYGILFFLNLVFMLLSASRKAILFMAFPLMVMQIMKSKNPLRVFRNVLIAIILSGIALIIVFRVDFLYALIGDRIEGMIHGFLGSGEVDASTKTRLELISDGMKWFEANPIWGYGLSNFKALCEVYRQGKSVYYAHNNYVELLVNCGIVGTVLYYSLLFKILLKGLLLWQKLNSEQLMFFGMLIVMLICDYGMVTYFDVFSQLMYLLIYISLYQIGPNSGFSLRRNYNFHWF